MLKDGCIQKAVRLIGEAGAEGARIILLPEAFIGGYPRGFSFGAVVGAYVAVGVVERAAGTTGTLYCSLLYFGPDGRSLGKHRKLKPTACDRLLWGEGDGTTLTVLDTEYGRVGGLICWENYMPLARSAMYAKGVGIYLAPTADARDARQATMVHENERHDARGIK